MSSRQCGSSALRYILCGFLRHDRCGAVPPSLELASRLMQRLSPVTEQLSLLPDLLLGPADIEFEPTQLRINAAALLGARPSVRLEVATVATTDDALFRSSGGCGQ